MTATIRKLLAHPLTGGLEIDDPETTNRRRLIIRHNRFLWRIYDEWYRRIAASVPAGSGGVLELGAGAGFLREYIPGLIASEVFACSDIEVVLDGRRLPFQSESLKAIVMVDVLHHIPDIQALLIEAQRCLRLGGAIAMIEPWVSRWSKLIYTRLHHEPFQPEAKHWAFPASGPLSDANGALPWIVFERDRHRFESEFRNLEIERIEPFMPFRYLVSGGVSMRQLMPAFTFNAWRGLESCFASAWAMFAFIRLRRR